MLRPGVGVSLRQTDLQYAGGNPDFKKHFANRCFPQYVTKTKLLVVYFVSPDVLVAIFRKYLAVFDHEQHYAAIFSQVLCLYHANRQVCTWTHKSSQPTR